MRTLLPLLDVIEADDVVETVILDVGFVVGVIVVDVDEAVVELAALSSKVVWNAMTGGAVVL